MNMYLGKESSEKSAGPRTLLKGLAVLTPFVLPGLEHVAHLVELGTLAGRAGLQAHAG